mgnify:CR=1 FL=1
MANQASAEITIDDRDFVKVEDVSQSRRNVQKDLVCMLMNLPLDCMFVDDMFVDGGLRQRKISEKSETVESIRNNGWDTVTTLCVVEVEWTDEEWGLVGA